MTRSKVERVVSSISSTQILIGPKKVIDSPDGFIVYNKNSISRFEYTNKGKSRFKRINYLTFKEQKSEIKAVFYIAELKHFVLVGVEDSKWLNLSLEHSDPDIDGEHSSTKCYARYATDLDSNPSTPNSIKLRVDVWGKASAAYCRYYLFHPPDDEQTYFEAKCGSIYHNGIRFISESRVRSPAQYVSIERDFYTYVDSFSFHFCGYNSARISYDFESFICAAHRLNDNKFEFIIATDSHEIFHLRTTDLYSNITVEKLIDDPVSIYINSISETQNELFFSSEKTGLLVYHKHTKKISYLYSNAQLLNEVNLGLCVSHKFSLPCKSWVIVTNDGKNSVISKQSSWYKLQKFDLKNYEFYKTMISKLPKNTPSDTICKGSIAYSNRKLSITLPNLKKPFRLKYEADYTPTGIKIFDISFDSLKFATFDNHNITICEVSQKPYKLNVCMSQKWKSWDYIIDVELFRKFSDQILFVLTVTGSFFKLNMNTNNIECIQSISGATQIYKIENTCLFAKAHEIAILDTNEANIEKSIFRFISSIVEIKKFNTKSILIRTLNGDYLADFGGDKILHELPVKSKVNQCVLFNDFIIATTSNTFYMINVSNFSIQLMMEIEPGAFIDFDAKMNLIFFHGYQTAIYEYSVVENTLKLRYSQENENLFPKLGIDTYRKKKIIGGFDSDYFQKNGYKALLSDTISNFKAVEVNHKLHYVYIDEALSLRICKVRERPNSILFEEVKKIYPVTFMDIHAERYLFYIHRCKAYILNIEMLSTVFIGHLREIENVLFLNHDAIDWSSRRLRTDEHLCASINKGKMFDYYVKKRDRARYDDKIN